MAIQQPWHAARRTIVAMQNITVISAHLCQATLFTEHADRCVTLQYSDVSERLSNSQYKVGEMITPIQRIKLPRLLAMLSISLAIVFLAVKGCELFPEATFTLASDSRLPKWVTLPPGLTVANVSLTMNYYAVPWRSAQFTLRDKN